MTLADSSDTALIGQLHATLESAVRELADWRGKAEAALRAAETLGARVVQLEVENDELRCGDLFAFHDGALADRGPTRVEKFLAHLATCTSCQDGLVDQRQIDARFSELAESRVPNE